MASQQGFGDVQHVFQQGRHYELKLLSSIKSRLGELWWYTLILFCVQRLGDVINAFVGLWLVPKYVPQGELGAVLPLLQVGGVLGLPLSILLVPFTKFLNTYATRGEYGKVKRLLRDVFVLSGILFAGTLIYARFFMPAVFVRLRIANGSLGLLIVASGMLGTVSPVFVNALQALKRFRVIAVVNLLSAPARLITMLIFMPIRALSGYFVGQAVPAVFSIFVSLFGLRRQLGRQVKSESYWQTDWRPLARYMLPVAMVLVAGALQAAVENVVIRHRLPDMDSAAYYIISRFAETGTYFGATVVVILFPLVAERHERGRTSLRMLWQAMVVSLVGGLILTLILHWIGGRVLTATSTWRPYAGYVPQMVLLTAMYALRASVGCFVQYEMACSRFRFLIYYGGILALECLLLYGLTGYGFFSPWLPASWIDWMASLRTARLDFLLAIMFGASVLCFCLVLGHLVIRHRHVIKNVSCASVR